MNLEGLSSYNSTDGLSLPIYDYANTYFLPLICLFGIVTSITNIIVLMQNKLENDINKYFLVNSCCDFVFLLTQIFVLIIRCGKLCSYSYTYGAKFYEAYIFRYIGCTIALFSLILDICFSIDRINSFKSTNRINKSKVPFKIRFMLLFLLTALICIPQYVLFKIPEAFGKLIFYDLKTNLTSYKILFQLKNRDDVVLKTISIALRYFRGYFLLCLLILLNLVIAYKFKNHLAKKKLITGC